MAAVEGDESDKYEPIEVARKEDEQSERVLNTRRWCSVPLCKSRKYRSLHKFPRDPELRKKWGIVCRIGKKITENMLVCRDHFLPSDFIPRWDGRLRRLKTIAIPSQNLPTRPLDKKLTSAQQKRKDDRAARAAKRSERVVPRILKGSSANKSLRENMSCLVSENDDTNELDDINSSAEASQSDVNMDGFEDYEACEDSEDRTEEGQITYIEQIYVAVCTCKNAKKVIRECKTGYEVKAAKVLLEFNEIIDEMVRCSEIIFPIKDIVLKRVEEFYQCARRSHKISFYFLLKSDNQLHAFTGIDLKLLDILSKSINVCEIEDSSGTNLCVQEKITLSLIKLRWNISFSSLANLFHISEHDCTNIFHIMLQILQCILKSAIYWPTQEDIISCMPESLENLKKTVMVMDYNEIKVEILKCPKCYLPRNSLCNSDNLKILLGFSQCGLITYVSKVQQDVGAAKEAIVDPCFISKILIPSNDAIMTDGCFIEQDCNRLFIELIKNRTERPFDPESMRTINLKEKSTTHIESAYKRFQKYRFFKSTVMNDEALLIDDITVIICGIVNLGNPIVVRNFNNLKCD